MKSEKSPGPSRRTWWSIGAVACGAVVARIGLVRAPFVADDLMQIGWLEGHTDFLSARSAFDLFRFFSGNPVDAVRMMSRGVAPWWTEPTQRIAHFRPLSSAWMAIDHALFGRNAVAFHLHTMIWLFLCFVVAGVAFRQVLPKAIALGASIVFLASYKWAGPSMWWCTRNALIAAVFGLGALVTHLHWRVDGWRPGRILSIVSVALALLAGESALQWLGYLLAFELLKKQANWRARLRALAPLIILVTVYVLIRKTLGYGALHSRVYIDPLSDPVAYLQSIIQHSDLAFIELFTDFRELLTSRFRWSTAMVVSSVCLTCLAGLSRRAKATGSDAPAVNWLLLGAALSLPPYFVSPRPYTMLAPLFGVSACVGLALRSSWHSWRTSPSHGLPQWCTLAAGILLVGNFILTPLSLLAQLTLHLNQRLSRGEDTIVDAVPSKARRVILIGSGGNDLNFAAVAALGTQRADLRIEAAWMLCNTRPGCTVWRSGSSKLLVDGRNWPMNELGAWGGPTHEIKPGDEVQLDGLRVRVLETRGSDVMSAEFQFDRRVDDPSLAFMTIREGGLSPLAMPEVGGRMVVK